LTVLAPPLEDTQPDGAVRRLGNVEIRPRELQVIVDGKRVGLTVREFEIFMVLADHHDRVITRPQIYELVWGGPMRHRDRSVDVFVRRVRTKLAACAPDTTFIHTHFGIGYRFAPGPKVDGEKR
jgi:DNA-binding response OmpR family regulator